MKRKALLSLMPKNKSDTQGAQAILNLGYPLVLPVLNDMLLFLKIYNSPVADLFANFFANLDPQPIDLIKKHISTKSETFRNRILVSILSKWPSRSVKKLSSNLMTLCTHVDVSNNDIECFKLILKHDLAEPKWVSQWIRFRKDQTIKRLDLLDKFEEIF